MEVRSRPYCLECTLCCCSSPILICMLILQREACMWKWIESKKNYSLLKNCWHPICILPFSMKKRSKPRFLVEVMENCHLLTTPFLSLLYIIGLPRMIFWKSFLYFRVVFVFFIKMYYPASVILKKQRRKSYFVIGRVLLDLRSLMKRRMEGGR